MITRLQYWLLTHPAVARPLKVLGLLYVLTCWAVSAAPQAAAATNAVVLNWTGLKDNYGVPAGDLYLSLASVRDLVTQTGPDASLWDPSSWWPWALHGMAVIADNWTAVNILTAEVSFAVGIITLGLWVFRLTVSTYWLTVLGEIARAVSAAVLQTVTWMGLAALTVPIGVGTGVWAIWRGERGRGTTLILMGFFIPGLTFTVFSDPAGLMFGQNGLLQFARRMAFSTAQAATHGTAISGGGFTGQVDTLTASLVTHTIREPLQVYNFGHVVDRVGNCGELVSAAYMRGASDGPIKALAQCGDTAAVAYAHSLGGSDVLGGAVLAVSSFLFTWFMCSAGFSVFKVSLRAIYTCAKLVPSVLAGGIAGAAQQHARATVWQFFKHPIEAMVYITFISVIGLAVERLITRTLPPELGGDNPFAHVLMVGAASVAALYLLGHLRADLEGPKSGRGMFGRAADVALGMGMHAALGGAGKAALGGARGLRNALGRGGKTPWEQIDERAASADPQEVLGGPQEGFDPVPGDDAGSGGAVTVGTGRQGQAQGGAPVADPVGAVAVLEAPRGAGAGVGQVLGGSPVRQPRGARRGGGAPRAASPQHSALDVQEAEWSGPSAPEVSPITDEDGRGSWERGAPPLSSYVADDAEIPLPSEPPMLDFDAGAAPPEDPEPPGATVDPITGH